MVKTGMRASARTSRVTPPNKVSHHAPWVKAPISRQSPPSRTVSLQQIMADASGAARQMGDLDVQAEALEEFAGAGLVISARRAWRPREP